MSEKTIINNEAFEQIEASEEGMADGGYTHHFKKPFFWEGKEYRTLHFAFESLTGRDMVNIEKEISLTEGVTVLAPAMSTPFLLSMAARACGLGADVLNAMPISDANKIASKARSFLLSAEA